MQGGRRREASGSMAYQRCISADCCLLRPRIRGAWLWRGAAGGRDYRTGELHAWVPAEDPYLSPDDSYVWALPDCDQRSHAENGSFGNAGISSPDMDGRVHRRNPAHDCLDIPSLDDWR